MVDRFSTAAAAAARPLEAHRTPTTTPNERTSHELLTTAIVSF
jgi:hypothetical protein